MLSTDPISLLDATKIAPRLYQGSAPPAGSMLARAGFDAVALCALEWQPPATHYHGVYVIRALLDDAGTPMTKLEWAAANAAAREVAGLLGMGHKVLVTCFMGRNRSGLVTALALHKATGMSGKSAVTRIQNARPRALENPFFVEALSKLKTRRRA